MNEQALRPNSVSVRNSSSAEFQANLMNFVGVAVFIVRFAAIAPRALTSTEMNYAWSEFDRCFSSAKRDGNVCRRNVDRIRVPIAVFARSADAEEFCFRHQDGRWTAVAGGRADRGDHDRNRRP
jgi:hypothetical protein